jgi:hypothetical protein
MLPCAPYYHSTFSGSAQIKSFSFSPNFSKRKLSIIYPKAQQETNEKS